MSNITQLPTREAQLLAFKHAVEQSVKAAFEQFSSQQIKELVMDPSAELRRDAAMKKAA